MSTKPNTDLMTYLRQNRGIKSSTIDSLVDIGFNCNETLLAMDVNQDLRDIRSINGGQRALLRQLIEEFKALKGLVGTCGLQTAPTQAIQMPIQYEIYITNKTREDLKMTFYVNSESNKLNDVKLGHGVTHIFKTRLESYNYNTVIYKADIIGIELIEPFDEFNSIPIWDIFGGNVPRKANVFEIMSSLSHENGVYLVQGSGRYKMTNWDPIYID